MPTVPDRIEHWLEAHLSTDVYRATVRASQRLFGRQYNFDNPHLPKIEREKFFHELSTARVYLEYGSGGSTIAAISRVPIVVSVENDRKFFAALKRKAAEVATSEYHLVFVNIGATLDWGEPKRLKTTERRLKRWRSYPSAPWPLLKQKGVNPDFIMIDGRFRVACTLESLLQLKDDSDCRIFFDDFEQYGDAYAPVLEFAEDVQRFGRALLFRPASHLDRARCRAVLTDHYPDYR